MAEKSVEWQWQGYTDDPVKTLLPEYEKLQFNDIYSFYQQCLQNKAIYIGIVGDMQQLNMKKLSKYGKVVILKDAQLFKE